MDYISGWCSSSRRLDGLTAIVTGCNTGIGKETVADFYARGARVIMGCRDINKANAAKEEIEKSVQSESKKSALIVEKLDVSSFNSVKQFAQRIIENEAHLQILVNNAGIMMCLEDKTEDGFEKQLATNHLGHALLTLLLLPKLIESGPSRVVYVSSLLHKKYELELEDMNFEKSPYNAYIAYCRSKAANVAFSRALANKLQQNGITNVTTYSLHPGVIGTELGRHFSSTILTGVTWLWETVFPYFLKSTKCGAQTTIYCAVDEKCANESGLYYSECAVDSPMKQCNDNEFTEKFWKWTLKSLNLQDYSFK